MNLVKIEGYEQYKKDTTTGGVVNTDRRSFENYQRAKIHAAQRNTAVVTLENEINSLKSDISDIKDILIQLLEKGK